MVKKLNGFAIVVPEFRWAMVVGQWTVENQHCI
jgi:hypothetical protein